MNILQPLAKLCAILAGILLIGITLMTCASLLGRNLLGSSLVGDFELTGLATGAAIALFMPYCQAVRGNIVVDFFTAGASPRTSEQLDRMGALLLAMVFALLTWRTTLGALNSFDTNSETQIMGFPEWTAYAAMVPPFALTLLIALHQAAFGFADDSKAPT